MTINSEASDEALLTAIAAGSQQAFNLLVDRRQQMVRAFLRRIAGREEAEDLAQETFMTVWTHARTFRGAASARTWMLGIAWRKAKSAQRSWFRSAARDGAYDQRAELERGGQVCTEDRIALERALDGLPLEQRAAVALCLAGDFSHSEAAEALSLPLGTVKSHVGRGRAKLLEALGGQP